MTCVRVSRVAVRGGHGAAGGLGRTLSLPGYRQTIGQELRIDSQSLDERATGGGGRRLEISEMRPGRLRIDVIGRDWRDAAPIVDTGTQQRGETFGAQVWRRLDVH